MRGVWEWHGAGTECVGVASGVLFCVPMMCVDFGSWCFEVWTVLLMLAGGSSLFGENPSADCQ